MNGEIHLYLITFNCALLRHDVATLSSHLLSGLESPSVKPDLIVLSLQEIAPLPTAFLGGPALTGYFETFSTAVRTATRKELSEDYALVARSNVGLTGIMVFARSPARVGEIRYAGVGVGLWEMGNKGGVGVKIYYSVMDGGTDGETVEINFLAAHLAPDEKNVRLRNENWGSIVRALVFGIIGRGDAVPGIGSASTESLISSPPNPTSYSGLYSPTAHLFVLGDLNYRAADSRPVGPEFIVFPQPDDPPSSNKHYSNLLEHDQLTPQRKANKTLHGLEEAPITFPPTYKYHISKTSPDDRSWNWIPSRWPSWTDRILYLPSEGLRVHKYTSIQEIKSSDHRPVVAHISIPAQPLSARDGWRVRPPYQPDFRGWRSARDAARRREVVVGCLACLFGTWAGWGILAAIIAGGLGGWWVLRELIVRRV
ncbi:DNase I-like protein [Tuber magnatum]|uniref:DNase I-like protein n=1 Tax=Tuber magnatum TaxID=42249 RepID=A0A317SWX7_9PEZI|nr:DNase I-like protein [Tuber magnatum]